MSEPIVELIQGQLKGKSAKTDTGKFYYKFKGIPYAKAPIGNLRFKDPQPAEPWQGILDATIDSKQCAQFDRATENVIGEEDCLYLNIYTPELPSEDKKNVLPVMFFIHGGGFLFGNGTDDNMKSPDYLIHKGVVIVSLNYRLGILGFLSIDLEDAPGNMGLKDIVMGLKWVQNNISKFGGDSGNVTIFGSSAGGAVVEFLMLSPMGKGLFHKAISQGGSSLNHWTQNQNIKKLAFRLPELKGKTIRDDKELLKYLKDLPLQDLITAQMTVLSKEDFKGGMNFGFVPTVERNSGTWEKFLSDSTYNLLKKGEFARVPFMTGFCTREALLLYVSNPTRFEELAKGKELAKYLPFDIDETQIHGIENNLKSIYLDGPKVTEDADDFVVNFFTDSDFLGGIYVSMKLIAKRNPVYFYKFSYDGKLNYMKTKLKITRKGAIHNDDAGYLMKCSILPFDECSCTDILVRDRMVEMWTNFAKFGKPTPEKNTLIPTIWEPVAENISYLDIDDQLTMKENLFPERVKLYERLYAEYYDLK